MAKAKAKDAATPEAPEVVKPEGEDEPKELVVTKGVGIGLFDEGSSGVFVPLADDLPIEQRRDAVRQVLQQAQDVDDKLNLMKGEMLYEAQANDYWKEWTFKPSADEDERAFASFEEYCEVEANLKRRAAYYLVGIYKKFVVELDLPKDVLKDLEWTKARELVPVIKDDNASELLDKVGGMSVSQVKELVQSIKAKDGGGAGGGASPDPAETKTKKTFRLNADQLSNIEQALTIAEGLTDSDDPAKQLDMICCEFSAGAVGMGLEGALARLEIVIKNVERAFGVKLDVKELADARYDSLSEEGDGEGEEAAETADAAAE